MQKLQGFLWRCICLFVSGVVVFSCPNAALAQQQCQEQQNKLNQLNEQRSTIIQKLSQKGLTNAAVNELLQQLKTLGAQITSAQNALQQCENGVPSGGGACTPVAPRPILPNCPAIQKQITELENAKTTLTKQLASPNLTAQQRTNLEQLLRMDNNQIIVQENALKSCHQAKASPTAPQNILEIAFQNPTYAGQTRYGLAWANQLVHILDPDDLIGNTFPESKDQGREWIQVLDPNSDYDNSIVGASGWAIDPRSNTVDFPFDHPFRPDWETSLALEMNQNGNGPYTFLLSYGDKGTPDHSDQLADESEASERGLPTCIGLLGIEMDDGLIPAQFKQATAGGNRLAVFGRWIVDAGHNNFRAEIHPPLMMASASVTPANSTRALFTSRPYLVGSTYTTDQSTIYVDSAPDDGYFFGHLLKEIVKATVGSQVEAHVKVKSRPFDGVQTMHFLVRPPAPAAIGGFVPKLGVSFHFTVRSGVAVHVSSSAPDTVDVIVTMNSATYSPPRLPAKLVHLYTPDELDVLNGEVGTLQKWASLLAPLGGIGAAIALVRLDQGIKGDQYALQDKVVDMLTQTNAVENADAANIPANAGITLNDKQPYPITGWIEVKWAGPVLVPKQPVAPVKLPKQPVIRH
jgi:biotin operon repressor